MIRVATVGTLLSLAIALGWAPATQARAGAEAPRATIGSSAPSSPAGLVATKTLPWLAGFGAGPVRAASGRGRVDPGDGGKVVNPDGTTTWRSTGCRHRKATRSSTLSWLCLTVTGPPTVTEGEPVTYVYKAHVRRLLERVALKIHVGGLRGWQWKRKYPVLRKGRTVTKTLTSTPKILDYGDGVRGTETYLQATVKWPEQFGTIGSTGILPAAP